MDRREILLGGGAIVAIGAVATLTSVTGMGSSSDYRATAAALRTPVADPVRDIIRHATLAPNGHNTQPWKFRVGAHRIDILPDLSRRTPVVDPDDHHLFVSLGCAAANLALAAAAYGRVGTLAYDPASGGSIAFVSSPGRATRSPLMDAIPRRQSTRADFDGRPVASADLRMLAAAAVLPGVDLVLITDRARIDRVRDLVTAGNSAQMADPAFVAELKSWLRFNPAAATRAGDGLYSVAGGNPALPDWLGRRAFGTLVTAKSENRRYARQINSSAGIAVFSAEQDSKAGWVAVGQACQQFALRATALGLKHAFINQPVEVARLRPDLAALAGIPGRRPDIVMRFGFGPTLSYSMRRPVDAVIIA